MLLFWSDNQTGLTMRFHALFNRGNLRLQIHSIRAVKLGEGGKGGNLLPLSPLDLGRKNLLLQLAFDYYQIFLTLTFLRLCVELNTYRDHS